MRKKPADSPRRPFGRLERLFREPGFFHAGSDQRGANKTTPKRSKVGSTVPTAEAIADMASGDEDISPYFTNKFTVVRPVQRVSVNLTLGMLRELDARAARLNISRRSSKHFLAGAERGEGFYATIKEDAWGKELKNARLESGGPSWPCSIGRSVLKSRAFRVK
jgi:hypothetical protein